MLINFFLKILPFTKQLQEKHHSHWIQRIGWFRNV